MNKDMINIDDFVREKLGNREEKEDPAAWLRMQALLDKELPERAIPLGFRFGKPLAYLGMALLAALVSVGGYKLANNTTPAASVTTTNNTGNNNNTQHSNASAAVNTSANTTAISSDNTDGSNNTNNTNASTTGKLSNNHTAADGTINNHTATAATGNHSTGTNAVTNTAAVINNNNTAAQQPKNTRAYNSTTANSLNRKATQPGNSINAANSTHTVTDPATTGSNNLKGNNTASTAANNNGTTQTRTTAANTLAGNKHNNNGAAALKPETKTTDATATATPANTASGNNKGTGGKDSMVAVGVTKRTTTTSGLLPRKTTYTSDSLDLGKVAVTTPTAPETPVADPAPEKQTMKSNAGNNYRNPRFLGANTPKQTPPVAASANTAAVPENNTAAATSATAETAKKKRDYFAFIRNINLSEVADNIKYDIGHAQFYMGASGGINYSPSAANSFKGVQFGGSGELVFNRHLSLMGELKYFNRSGGYKTVDDSYIKQHTSASPDSVNSRGYWYTVRTDSTNRYFNFSTLHSFEMPITLRYAFRKFYLMTGINVAYYLGLNVEEISTQYNNLNPTAVAYNYSKGPIFEDPKQKLAIQDFGSRYGVGYIFGAGYQINPSIQIDLRVVNTFWDNSKTEGAKHLSKDFYKIPSVQLNFGYQFNREKKEPARFGPGQ